MVNSAAGAVEDWGVLSASADVVNQRVSVTVSPGVQPNWPTIWKREPGPPDGGSISGSRGS